MRVCLSAPGLADILAEELGSRTRDRFEDLFVIEDEAPVAWAQNIWTDAREFKFESISQAAAHLRAIQRNWWLHSVGSYRRASLIQAALPPLKAKPSVFFAPPPSAPLGSWTLVDANTMLYSASCTSAYPDGELHFVENKTEPPSRAYLKLWETFTLLQRKPQPGELVLDLGSSPGGWTWVLDQTGCRTIAVDKAPFASTFKPSTRVEYREQSAFALEPKEVGHVDWLFSDIICYPERLLSLVHKWLDHADNLVCTIKFQGKIDHSVTDKFRAIPGADVRHLFCNKHELTFTRLKAR